MFYRPDAGDRYRHFIRVTVGQPRDVGRVVRWLETPDALASVVGADRCYDTQPYESNVAFPLRFMVDHGLVGGGWVSLVAGTATLVDGNDAGGARTAAQYPGCQWRVRCGPGALVSHNDPVQVARARASAEADDDAELARWSRLARGLRVLVLSVTTVPADAVPGANGRSHERVAVVACACQRGASGGSSGDGGWQTIAFARAGPGAAVVDRPAPTDALVAFHFPADDAGEAALLQAFHAFYRQFDPDFVVGYEPIEQLELLLQRANDLGVPALDVLGRPAAETAHVRSSQIYTASWVRAQRRMASTSNHEFKVGTERRGSSHSRALTMLPLRAAVAHAGHGHAGPGDGGSAAAAGARRKAAHVHV